MTGGPEVLSLFATPVVLQALPAAEPVRETLREAILSERDDHSGMQVSQVGGWHSVPDYSQRAGPYRTLIQAIVNAVDERVAVMAAERRQRLPPYRWSVQSWAIVLESGGYNRIHDHVRSHWSVAYYVDAGDPRTPLGGALTLIDPRRSATLIPGLDLDPVTLDVPARTGMLAIFPGYLQHMVHPYDGTRPRICVSANLSLAVQP